jgi:hypothetical protein
MYWGATQKSTRQTSSTASVSRSPTNAFTRTINRKYSEKRLRYLPEP